MKQQGKRLLLGLQLVGMLALAGCGGQAITKDSAPNAASLLQQARDGLAAADSYTADFSAIVRSAEDEIGIEAEISFVEEPLFLQVDAIYTADDMAQKWTTYLLEEGERATLYRNYGKQWTELTVERGAAVSNLRIYQVRDTALALLDVVQEVRIAEQTEDTTTITATLPQSQLFDFQGETSLLRLTGLGTLPDSAFDAAGDVPVLLTLDRKTHALLSYELDLREAAEAVMNAVMEDISGGLLEDAVRMEAYTITADIHQLGDVQPQELPPEVKSCAVNYEEEFYLMAQQ